MYSIMLSVFITSISLTVNNVQASTYMPVGSCHITHSTVDTVGVGSVYSFYVPASDELKIGHYTGRIDITSESYSYTVDNAQIHVKDITAHEISIGAEFASKYQFKDVVVFLDYTFPSSLNAPPGSGNRKIIDKVNNKLECYRTVSELHQHIEKSQRVTEHINN